MRPTSDIAAMAVADCESGMADSRPPELMPDEEQRRVLSSSRLQVALTTSVTSLVFALAEQTHDRAVQLRDGDGIGLYTDVVTELMNKSDVQFGLPGWRRSSNATTSGPWARCSTRSP
jgi:hypothetical protein